MKNNKTTGQDGIPAEVWKHSKVVKEELFTFLQQVWRKETVTENLVVCIFVMMYKNKVLQTIAPNTGQ